VVALKAHLVEKREKIWIPPGLCDTTTTLLEYVANMATDHSETIVVIFMVILESIIALIKA